MSNRPRILVSSCLLGQKVRYDGNHKLCPIINELKDEFEIIPVCPEMSAGLGVPRPPINLHFNNNRYQALGAEDVSFDVTDKLIHWTKQFLKLNSFHGAILKSKSPSCGYKTTPVYQQESLKTVSNGLFTMRLLENGAELPIIDETQIDNIDKKKQFLKNVWRQFNVC